jgi:hypothetical protein
MSPDGVSSFAGRDPSVAYNSKRSEYLVVWIGNDNILSTGETEVWGQRVHASTGALIGEQIQISQMVPDRDSDNSVKDPQVAYNLTRDEFLVVWQGNDYYFGFREDFEIWGQRLDYKEDKLVEKGEDFKISQMGPPPPSTDSVNYVALEPAIAYNSHPEVDEYLVVWHGDDQAPGLAENEYEIFGQRLGYSEEDGLVETGRDDFRISYMGTSDSDDFRASSPDIAYNTNRNEYLVVWWGDTNSSGLIENEYEIWGKRVNWDDSPAGPQRRISDMGVAGNISYAAYDPAAAFNPDSDQYLVVWSGAEQLGDPFGQMLEVYGQLLNYDSIGNLVEAVPNDFQITHMDQKGHRTGRALNPDAAYNTHNKNYMVVWRGGYDNPPLVNEEFEVYGQLLDKDSNLTDPLELRLSETGPDGDTGYQTSDPAVAAGMHNSFLTVWRANPGTAPMAENEDEIFGQFFTSHPLIFIPVVMK